ncbi:MAG: hypothetical protein JNG90_13560 [Planctomycetaceae bacterium]|nr:hypothetical protein [Planctomycetaceae bacterium]
MVNDTARRVVHLFEMLAIVALLLLFGRVTYAKFYSGPADVLDGDADPRLMVVELVSLQQLAESSQTPHRIQLKPGPHGTFAGYEVLYQSTYGDPWVVLRGRTFPKRVKVTSSQAQLEFDAEGRIAAGVEMHFELKGRRWRITLAKGTGELRMVPVSRGS